jgi:DegV family protein with EDD domain
MLCELDVLSVPLIVNFKGTDREDTVDTGIKEMYAGLRAGEAATTSAVNPDRWGQLMETALAEGKDVLTVTFSSGLSTTYQSAVIAAKELQEVYPDRTIRVVDTLCAALGQGLLVWYAAQKRDEGMTIDELTAWVEANKLNICHWVTVDDLSHLKRGGRISATTALVGTMLNIKPIIYVNEEGKLINTAKVRGRKAAIDFLVKKAQELGEGYDNETMFVAHGDCPEDAAALEAALKEKCGVKNVITGYVGPVIGAHTGPGVLVLFFLGSQR